MRILVAEDDRTSRRILEAILKKWGYDPVVTEDGTKYVSSVRYGSVSRIRPGKPAEVIATGIPSAASMCYDSKQKQLVIPMNPNNALAFIKLRK